ncbi:MAG: hypothetical protein E6K80_02855 [Candidatus Eisenbacteria bacterium]|uniref:histidine kinase n=1 Tax=Eiseniibacteriota bacterium TaxID=2212470 RepID=A0A538U941_UNCEI|nr:MAG: hypothetical protein E6K80_02855 [Candidatus Eisenbacteria bacterium]
MQAKQRIAAMESEHRQLNEELANTNRRLSELNKELQDANEELQASNEELMLTQEELQATNEEFEATNEELQATNEELETNNEELQATNEELETTNEELVARSSELHELNQIIALERLRLTQMVELAPFHIGLVTGPSMIVESLNIRAGRFGDGLVKGVGLDASLPPELHPLVDGVHEVYRTGRAWTGPPLSIDVQDHPGEEIQRLIEFTVVPHHDSKDKVIGAALYGVDVTDAQSHEEQARLERYRLMIEHAHQVALALFDAGSGTLVYASPAFAELVLRQAGISNPGEVASGDPLFNVADRRWQDLGFLAPQEAQRAFEEVIETRQPRRLSRISLGSSAASETIWDCSLIPAHESARGAIRYVVVSAVDVTEQVRAHDELQRTDRLKDQFLSLASHELRTPLTPLSMYTEILNRLLVEEDRGPKWKGQMQEVLAKFQAQIAHIARLADDLVDVARLESDRLSIEIKPVDLKSVLKRAREQSAGNSSQVPVNLRMPDEPAQVIVMGDHQRLLQVVGNLLGNAARHATGTDSVAVSLTILDRERKARIEVRDSGPGIAPEVMGSLFTRFSKGTPTTQASRSGLGLGLFISRGIVEQHRGTIAVRSKLGEGASFIVELPLAD